MEVASAQYGLPSISHHPVFIIPLTTSIPLSLRVGLNAEAKRISNVFQCFTRQFILLDAHCMHLLVRLIWGSCTLKMTCHVRNSLNEPSGLGLEKTALRRHMRLYKCKILLFCCNIPSRFPSHYYQRSIPLVSSVSLHLCYLPSQITTQVSLVSSLCPHHPIIW